MRKTDKSMSKHLTGEPKGCGRMQKPQCLNCRYYDTSQTPLFEGNAIFGECKRHAPTRSPVAGPRNALWPQVSPDMWCGEHAWKTKPPIDNSSELGTLPSGPLGLIEKIYDENHTLLMEAPYIFRRLFKPGQSQVIAATPMTIISCEICKGEVFTVVKLHKPWPDTPQP